MASIINLIVRDPNGQIVEVHENLVIGAANVGDPNYIETRVNKQSKFIRVEDLGGFAPVEDEFELDSGADGLGSLVDADFIGDPDAKTGIYSLSHLEHVRIIAVPGVTSPAVHAALLAYAEASNRVFAILSAPQGLTPAEALDYRTGEGVYDHIAFNSSFGALYWQWVRFYDPRTRSDEAYMPPDGVIAGLFARNDEIAYPWDAPAGMVRGVLRNVLGVHYEPNEQEVGLLYDAGINSIVVFPTDGAVVWGQKTLQAMPSATDRINVRRALIQWQYDLQRDLRYLLFEPNVPRTWAALKRKADAYFQRVKDLGGLADFLVVCDETTNTPDRRDRNEMAAKFYLDVARTGEFLELDFILTPSGTDFSAFQG